MLAAKAVRRSVIALGCVAALSCDQVLGTKEFGEELLEAVLDELQAGSIRRDSVDWVALRAAARAEMTDPTNDVGAYPAISRAIQLVGDNHSWFRRPNGTFLSIPRSITCNAVTVPNPSVMPADIGYVRVASFGGSGAASQSYMAGIRAQIQAADGPQVVGWVVDLRGNGGGNMWPMITVLYPFLSGNVGRFITPDGAQTAWTVSESTSYAGPTPSVTFAAGPYVPVGSTERVAVLLDKRVASSGEATAIAFRGRPHTRFFGDDTCGISTAVRGVEMPGGHLLGLTGAWMADRDGVIYGSGIAPDERIADPDAVLARAIEWLRETP